MPARWRSLCGAVTAIQGGRRQVTTIQASTAAFPIGLFAFSDTVPMLPRMACLPFCKFRAF